MLRNVYYYKVVLENEVEVFFGEYSPGWKFIFRSHNHLYETSKRGINRFLKLHKYDIFVEYRDDQGERIRRGRISVENIWKTVKDSESNLDLKKFYNYPHCLEFYDCGGVKRFSRKLKSEEEIKLFDRLPTKLIFLTSALSNEYTIDGLRWQDKNIINFEII